MTVASVETLADRVIELAGDPIDRWEVAVAIETFGLAATTPAATTGDARQPLFPLSLAVYEECVRRRASRPEVTVSMPAYNRAHLIRTSIESVLAQEGVTFELIVVDDGSSDGTAEAAESIVDPRIRVVRNAVRGGVSRGHNLVTALSRSPFIAHADSDDIVLPGGLRRVVDRVAESADHGHAHSLYAFIEPDGTIDRDEMRRQWTAFHQRRAGLDYRAALLRHGSVMNHLRVYRREVFPICGGFDPAYGHGEDLELSLRVLETHDIVGVPEILYLVRQHGGRNTALRFSHLRFWFERVAMVHRLMRRRAITYPRQRRYRAWRQLLRGLPMAFRVPRTVASLRAWLGSTRARAMRSLRRARRTAIERVYGWLTRLLGHWPAPRRCTTASSTRPPKVAYFLWQYPVTSQTFVRRELAALARQGVAVTVIAEEHGAERDADIDLDGAPPASLLFAVDRATAIRYLLRHLVRRPWSAPSLLFWLVGHRYGRSKNWREDLGVFGRAVRLAVLLEREGVTRVHTPWADRSALVARLASALLRIPYSVQGRAHDLQRERFRVGLPERLAGAEFVVCGARFAKERLLEEIVPPGTPVHVVYEGLEPARLASERRVSEGGHDGRPLRLLTVARLIEEKGIVPLLAVAAELRRRGVAIAWRVVGGTEEPASTNYLLEVRRLHRRLELEDVVRFTGSLPFAQVAEEYSAADVFVLPCVTASNGGRDMTPNSILEAMAMALPVVSSRQTGIPELAPDGECALLVEPGNVAGYADAVARLAASAELRRSLGARGRARVVELFDVDRNAAALARLFAGGQGVEA